MKNKVFALISVFVALIFLGGHYFYNHLDRFLPPYLVPPESAKVDLNKPLREQVRTVEIAGRKFSIPIMYIISGLKPGTHQDDILLFVIWPNMMSTHEVKDREEYRRIWQDEHREGDILIEPAVMEPSLDEQVSNSEKYFPVKDAPKIGSLEKHLWYLGQPGHPTELSYEVYLLRSSIGKVIAFIRCNPPGPLPYPRCTHKFVDNGLIYEIDYNKAVFFSQYAEQQQRAIDFMRGMEITPNSKH